MNFLKKFPRTFWIANTVELFERWAWYGLFNVLALYLTLSQSSGALGFSQQQKGLLMGIITAMVYFLPIFTGAISDKFGYKKSILISFVLYIIGFAAMSQFRTFPYVFLSFSIVGLGAAIFKPLVSATVAKTTDSSNSSIGFGIFYMMVNIGSFIGPIVSSKLRETSWNYVFISSIFAIFLNFLLVFFFYKEPQRNENTEKLLINIKKILLNLLTVIKNVKFLLFLLIIVGFWSVYFQLFYTLPIFIEQWFDTTVLYNAIYDVSPWFASIIGTHERIVNPEMIINIDALFIILFQVLISTLVMKWKPLRTMITGFIIFSLGIGLMFMFNSPIFIIFALLIFSIGEMMSSPKITEYIGHIAPADNKAMYMGTSFLPIAGGNFFAGILSGSVYNSVSDKYCLLQKYFKQHSWDIPSISKNISQSDFINIACQKLNMSEKQLTQFLWNTYQPQSIWYYFTSIVLVSALLLFLFDKMILKDINIQPKEN